MVKFHSLRRFYVPLVFKACHRKAQGRHTEERICSNTLQKGQTLDGHHADGRWMSVVTAVGDRESFG